MEICVICNECNNELIVKSVEKEKDGTVLVRVERCLCKDEDLYQEGYDSGVNDVNEY